MWVSSALNYLTILMTKWILEWTNELHDQMNARIFKNRILAASDYFAYTTS